MRDAGARSLFDNAATVASGNWQTAEGLARSAYQTTESGAETAWHSTVDPTRNAYDTAEDVAVLAWQGSANIAQANYHTAMTNAQTVWNTAEAIASGNYQTASGIADAAWTSGETGAHAGYDSSMAVAETAWTTSETGAWSLYDGAESAARGIRDATDSTANGVFQGVLTAATAIWTTTESAAWSTEQSAITLATTTWTGSESVARSTEQSAVDTATQAQTTTTQGLQTQADQAWQTYLSSLAPGDPPTVTQQPLLDTALACGPGLSAAAMMSMLGGPPAATPLAARQNTPMCLPGQPGPTILIPGEAQWFDRWEQLTIAQQVSVIVGPVPDGTQRFTPPHLRPNFPNYVLHPEDYTDYKSNYHPAPTFGPPNPLLGIRPGTPGSSGFQGRDPRQLAAVMAEREREQNAAVLARNQSEHAAAVTAMTAMLTAQRQMGMYVPPPTTWIAFRPPVWQWRASL